MGISRLHESFIRALDCTAAVTILLLLWPFMLAAALAVRLTSTGPALYKQQRVGKTGRVFILYKFRTMVNNAERHCGPVWASADDARITAVGKILRKTHLDELPQLLNVLAGDMSLVGPRPERPVFVRRHRALQGMRLTVRPGLTGLAQVRNRYDLRPDHKVKYDRLYIQKRSVLLNAYILLQTIRVVFTRKGR
jgi:lipopolysaccharide/colanic/teichoic acid biosynthesis glycosyltransferase